MWLLTKRNEARLVRRSAEPQPRSIASGNAGGPRIVAEAPVLGVRGPHVVAHDDHVTVEQPDRLGRERPARQHRDRVGGEVLRGGTLHHAVVRSTLLQRLHEQPEEVVDDRRVADVAGGRVVGVRRPLGHLLQPDGGGLRRHDLVGDRGHARLGLGRLHLAPGLASRRRRSGPGRRRPARSRSGSGRRRGRGCASSRRPCGPGRPASRASLPGLRGRGFSGVVSDCLVSDDRASPGAASAGTARAASVRTEASRRPAHAHRRYDAGRPPSGS